jgi:hypothetical protein
MVKYLRTEMMIIGTRKPRPIGEELIVSPLSFTVVNSPVVLTVDFPLSTAEGGHGGGIWSKKPPFSS